MATIYTYVDTEAEPRLAAVAYINARHGSITTVLGYQPEYLQHHDSYPLDPEFELQSGNWPATHELPGCFADASPDRWGRNLIKRRYPERSLTALDYLLETSDISRQGALRFKTEQNGEFLHAESTIPKLIALPQLLDATYALDNAADGSEAVKYLLDAGTASLGGARPKAVVEDKGRLYLAKFSHKHDEYDVIEAEYQALHGAAKRGIQVPPCRLVALGSTKVLLVERFDRTYQDTHEIKNLKDNTSQRGNPILGKPTLLKPVLPKRVGYISALTALNAQDGEQRDYLEIIDFLLKHGSRPKDDIRELLRRIRYTIDINNTDDHLRNHGFIREKGGWHLSPVFDLNPNPDSMALRQTSLAGKVDAEGSLQELEKLEQRWQ